MSNCRESVYGMSFVIFRNELSTTGGTRRGEELETKTPLMRLKRKTLMTRRGSSYGGEGVGLMALILSCY